jgi:hypothetical protein
MKKIVLFATVVVMALCFLSCRNSAAVKDVSQKFLQAYYVDNDFNAAKDLSTDATKEGLDYKAMLFAANPNSEEESLKAFEIKKIEAKKTKAICFYEIEGQERRLNLRKVNNAWLVDMPESASGDPELSLSQSGETGGFASASSEPVRLGDIPIVE